MDRKVHLTVPMSTYRIFSKFKGYIAVFALVALPHHGFAEDRFHIDVPYTDGRILEEETYIVYTHPSSWYDVNERTRFGVEKLNRWAKMTNLPQVLLFSGNLDNKNFYLSSAEVDLTVASGAGQHQLTFPNVKHIVQAGGNLGLCLCESIRDTIAGSSAAPLRISLVTDATYDSVTSIAATSVAGVKKYIQKHDGQASVSLEDLRRELTTEEFLEFIKERILANNVLCPNQGRRLPLDGLIKIDIRRGNQFISVGSGERSISLNLMRTQELIAEKKFYMDPAVPPSPALVLPAS